MNNTHQVNTSFYNKDLDVAIDPIHLGFDKKEYEYNYFLQNNREYLIASRIGIILTLLIDLLFIIVDPYIYPISYAEMWLIRGLGATVLSMAFVYTFVSSYINNLQKNNIILSLIISMFILYMFSYPPESEYIYIYISYYVLYIAGVKLVLGLRFIYALPVTLMTSIGIVMILSEYYDTLMLVLFTCLFLAGTLYISIGSYFSELRRRMLFLNELYTSRLLKDLKQTQEHLEKQANQDPLTLLYNRRYFKTVSKDLVNISHRENTSLSIIMIDIDNFKKINDTYGHDIGDDVIILLSEILLNATRKSDICFRTGGEEFLALLPHTHTDGATIIAKKILDLIHSTPFVIGNEQNINWTASIGISCISTDETSIEPALVRSDKAMYEAKRDGKDQIRVS